MIRSGQTIENPVAGEVLIFHKTSRDTGGEYVGKAFGYGESYEAAVA